MRRPEPVIDILRTLILAFAGGLALAVAFYWAIPG